MVGQDALAGKRERVGDVTGERGVTVSISDQLITCTVEARGLMIQTR